ncbi:lysylphosphatidylglycerol synthase domain-containing protein [Acetobacteraceae bacterium ESL0709]|nr:lysylphosphatidylglycerol synthase domain-containing protein [Acetobacteraceae bacterium ESL0697]MDF7677824.1 lysylphosphatidylglycerol synthase domain-containing protein [Acetobacteraceae bacterium ESL0709]
MTRDYPSCQGVEERGQAEKGTFCSRYLPALLGMGLLIAAIIVIWRQFRHLSLGSILASVQALPVSALWSGVGATILAYGFLVFYDGLACRHVKAGLSWGKIAFVSFCAYVLAHNLGCAAISGTAVRYRLYRNWGVPGRKIASIVALCSLTYFLGMIGLVGLILLWQPGTIPLLSHYGPWFPRILGAGCFLALGLYVLAAFKKRAISFRHYRIEVPDWDIALGQILVSMADMSATALIAWCLIGPLPNESTLTFGSFLGIYLFSYTAGLLANIPGGLGIFDGAMMVALSPWLPVSHIMATLLMFRVLYYLVPLMLAGVLFAAHELMLKAHSLRDKSWVIGRNEQNLRQSEAYFAVRIAAGVQLLLGISTICYVVMSPIPPFSSELYAAFAQFVTLSLGLAGVVLIAASFGLLNRVASAWRLSVRVLCSIEGLLALRHAGWGTYLIVFCALLVLLPFRHSYYRKATIRSEPFSAAFWLFLALSIASLGGMWWVDLKQHLGAVWWVAMVRDSYGPGGRCFMLGLALGCFLTSWWSLRRTYLHPYYWTPHLAAAYACLDEHKRARDFFGQYMLRPDGFFYDESRQAAIAFVRRGLFILALGGPVGNPEKTQAAVWRLRDYAMQEGCCLAFLQESERCRKLYEALGLSLFYLTSDSVLFCTSEMYQTLKLELKAVLSVGNS